MAKPITQRVKEYRGRLALRASYYEALNDHRVSTLGLGLDASSPEERAVREMCLNYPPVSVAPSAIGWMDGDRACIEVWYLDDRRRPSLKDMAAAFAALREITSAEIQIAYTTHEGCGAPDEGALVSEAALVFSEVRQLREAGLWFRK